MDSEDRDVIGRSTAAVVASVGTDRPVDARFEVARRGEASPAGQARQTGQSRKSRGWETVVVGGDLSRDGERGSVSAERVRGSEGRCDLGYREGLR